MNKIFKTSLTLIAIWYSYVLISPKVIHCRMRAMTAKGKAKMVQFMDKKVIYSTVTEKELSELQKSVYLDGKGYLVTQKSETLLLAEPIEKYYYKGSLIDRIIWLKWEKVHNKSYILDLNEKTLKPKDDLTKRSTE